MLNADSFYAYLAGKIGIIVGITDTRKGLGKAIRSQDKVPVVCKVLDDEIARLNEIALHSHDRIEAQNLLSRLRDLLCPSQ